MRKRVTLPLRQQASAVAACLFADEPLAREGKVEIRIFDAGVEEEELRSQLMKSAEGEATLVVPENMPADEVAEVADRQRAKLLVLIDRRNRVSGMVVPDAVVKAVELYLQEGQAGFAGAVHNITGRLGDSIADFLRRAQLRPDLRWCDEGKHLTPENPCTLHEM